MYSWPIAKRKYIELRALLRSIVQSIHTIYSHIGTHIIHARTVRVDEKFE